MGGMGRMGGMEDWRVAEIPAGIPCRRGDFVDEAPGRVIFTELTRTPRPLPARTAARRGDTTHDSTHDWRLRTNDYRLTTNQYETSSLLAFRLEIVLVAIETRECGDVGARPLGQQPRVAPGHRRGQAHSRDRVPHVVLTVAERTLAVFPRFSPMDGRQSDQPAVRLHPGVSPCRRIECAAPLETMAIGRVVIDAGRIAEPGRFTNDDVRFGRMEIPARRIDPQRPARGAKLLPRREAEGVAKNGADNCGLWIAECGFQGFSGGGWPRRKRDEGSACKGSERIGLGRPVEITQRPGVPMEMVLRAVVIRADGRVHTGIRHFIVASVSFMRLSTSAIASFS